MTHRADAIVLCIEEKSQIQALDRTAPVLAMQPGLPSRRTHDDKRHGTPTLFAALEIATGKVTGAVKARHRHQEFLAFLKQVARAYSQGELHLVMDSYAHFTPTWRSWLNLVEVWFGIIERQAIHLGTFTSIGDLNANIRAFVNGWNDRAHPFVWTKTAGEILKQANRQTTSNMRHYDVVLMDVHMPVMDGLDAARIIAYNPELVPSPWLMALTAGVFDSDRQVRNGVGCDRLGEPTAGDEAWAHLLASGFVGEARACSTSSRRPASKARAARPGAWPTP